MAVSLSGSRVAIERQYWGSYGATAGEILRHAVDKFFVVQNLEEIRGLRDEKALQRDKLLGRTAAADALVGVRPELRLTNHQTGMVVQGVLDGFSLEAASLQLETADGEPQDIVYARNNPVPEGFNQTYFGMGLVHDHEVLSVAQHGTWIFER
ncbi:hypothetical protein EYC59_04005 [Candidatus Saccharibacteria bacterium]|nr:MAG: hypothetical protein EYC59_04005 [Candidatus Saccharibacteria bacterium]